MSGGFAPWWRRELLRWFGLRLFRLCPGQNWHWRWEKMCICCYGENGQQYYIRVADYWIATWKRTSPCDTEQGAP